MRQRGRNICFTAWCDKAEIQFDTECMTYLIIGVEVCPTSGQQHLQGYVEFVRQLDFGMMKNYLGGDKTHLEKRRATAKQAATYCMKDNKFEEFGERSMQGKRTDLEDVAEDILQGSSVRTVAMANPVQYIKYSNGIHKLKAISIEPRCWVTEVIVLYGGTGCGKSKHARELLEDYWVWAPQMGEWFDGYEGQGDVIMEEYRGQLPFGMLLTLLDRYECRVQYKGGSIEFAPKRIVITSPTHPTEWYETVGSDKIEQLLRRITKVTQMTQK